ncbi:hypothetical protein BDV27DRAFT_166382 [Aspergillus caelatus]|uniref:Choline monooxygenase, chloroplastic n=1 Tax=Aspergillus caelatus TaxID=61420 RepID=A0A5N7AGW7_9EURO|nr:uncharacterized protein BDV27DRAFT_166382 [Aspergillus caelatus]KAE8369104.1 hypothetical protein BDV27DRAFT_166382 [Aspergillus caelatus]
MTELARTLPASWYCSLPLYQLERRAVFMKSWYLLGPVTKFQKVGEKIEYEIAQQPILAFRASGSSSLPEPGEFHVICAKTGNPLRYHITPTGLIFTTLSDEAPSFHEYFPDLEPLLERVDFTKLPYRHSIKYEGRFNWKTMVDGYQECLHCQYTHPSFSVYYPPTFYTVHNHQNFSQHIADPNKPDDGLFLYFFPNCTLNVYGGGMSSFRVCPTEDPNITRMEFDYYHMESGEKFKEYFKFVRQVAMEDYELCEKAQDNLGRGVYSEGILNPEKENGVSSPTLLALLAGIAFLYRFWPYRSTPTPKLLNPEKSATLGTIPDVTEEENRGVFKESDFPAGWWVSKDVFELEKRAIFSKTWLCLSHRNRFAKVGDYQSFEVAGFPIFLILGKDGKVRAFHNVCRHRAYTVTKKECGSSAVLGCRYHGWSYNTYGELTKAPHFDDIPGFDRSQNSLFAIHTVTNGLGFIFVNLEASPRIPSADTSLLDAFASNNRLDSQSIWVAGQTIKADFNWKMTFRQQQLIDFLRLENEIEQKSNIPQVTSILNYVRAKSEHFSLFPFTSFYSMKRTGWWCALSFLPVSEQKTAIRYDLYCSKIDSSRSQVAADKLAELLEEKARELETEYQEYKNILDCLEAHIKLEKAQGVEVFPAMRKPRENSRFQQAEQLCKELDCKSELIGKDLAW